MSFTFITPSWTHLIPSQFSSQGVQQNIPFDIQSYVSSYSDCNIQQSNVSLPSSQSKFVNFYQHQTQQQSPGSSISSSSYSSLFPSQQSFLSPLESNNLGYSQYKQQLGLLNINSNNRNLHMSSTQIQNCLQPQQFIPAQASQLLPQVNSPSSQFSMIYPPSSIPIQHQHQFLIPLQKPDPELFFQNNSSQFPILSAFTQDNSSNSQKFPQANNQLCTVYLKEQAQAIKTDFEKQPKQFLCNQLSGDSKIEEILKKDELIQVSSQIPTQSSTESNQKSNETVVQQKLIFKLTDSEKQVLSQLNGINMQNAFKNIIKAFISFINKSFDKVYFYEYKEKPQTQYPSTQSTVKLIETPTSDQKKMFLQKFNKFMKSKKYNNASIRQIIENRLYSTVLKDYIQNHSKEWVFRSNFHRREDIITVLQYFSLCCDNKNLLLFLSKFSGRYEIN